MHSRLSPTDVDKLMQLAFASPVVGGKADGSPSISTAEELADRRFLTEAFSPWGSAAPLSEPSLGSRLPDAAAAPRHSPRRAATASFLLAAASVGVAAIMVVGHPLF